MRWLRESLTNVTTAAYDVAAADAVIGARLAEQLHHLNANATLHNLASMQACFDHLS